MNKFVLLSACMLLICVNEVRSEELMAFAFELIRHGARAPLDPNFVEGFTVDTCMLTP